jgi:hypothetical protein
MARLDGFLQITPQDLYTESSLQMGILGTMASTGDGRFFRYVKTGGTALVPGKLYQSAAETTGWENLACAAAVKGDKTIVTTSTITATANQLAGGYVTVTAAGQAGAGYSYKIAGNTAAAGAVCTIYLEDPLLTALTVTASTIDIIANPFAEVILSVGSGSGCTGTPIGVAVYPVTAEYYGWVQVKGPCGVLADGGITVGAVATVSNSVAGALEIATNASTEAQPAIGTAITGISTGEYGLIDLMLA